MTIDVATWSNSTGEFTFQGGTVLSPATALGFKQVTFWLQVSSLFLQLVNISASPSCLPHPRFVTPKVKLAQDLPYRSLWQ